MSLRHNTLFAVAALGTLSLLPACNPYQNFSGEYYAGPIDPTNFNAQYLGEIPGTPDQSGGTIVPASATIGGAPTFYYLFNFGDNELGSAAGPLTITSDSADGPVDNLPIVGAYVFDPTATSAFPSPSRCKAPANYVFDQRLEAYRSDEQGVIFTKVPSAADYIPIVQQTAVTSNGEACQDPKSKAAVAAKRQDLTVGTPAGKYLAFAMVDPGADVQPNDPNTHLGPIHLGFYNHYLVAFIDGGYIPTVDVPAGGADMPAHTDFKTQKVYFPSSVPVTTTDPDTMMDTTAPGPGALGGGFDILEAARSDAAYSPICEVWTYDPDVDATTMLPVPEADIAAFTATETASAMPTGDFVYCLQVF